MEVTKELRHEHKYIGKMIGLLEKMSERLVAGDESMVPHLRKAVAFVKGFADGCHHDKEEKLLFPTMVEHGVPKEGGPIGVMLEDHELGRQHISRLTDALNRYEEGDKSAALEVAESVKGYTHVLRAHIHKENMVLFPAAEKLLTDPEKEDLGEKMEKIEKERPGKTHHEYLHDLKDIEEALSKKSA